MRLAHCELETLLLLFPLIGLGHQSIASNETNSSKNNGSESDGEKSLRTPSFNHSDNSELIPSSYQLNNLTRCSNTDLLLTKETLTYSWDLRGFLGYYQYMKRFDQVFELKTEDVNFKSDVVDGKWYFKLTKVSTPTPGMGVASNFSGDDVILSAVYQYEAKQPKRLSFYIHFSLLHNEKEVFLPVQKSSTPVVMQQRLYNRRGYSSYLEYIHTFTWSDLGPIVESLWRPQQPSSQKDQSDLPKDGWVNDQGMDNEDVSLRLLITAYFPSEPVYMGSEKCRQLHLLAESHGPGASAMEIDHHHQSNRRHLNPPYLKHSNSMLHNDRYADVILKARDKLIPAHKIILATSSPVLSAMIYNASNTTEEQDSTLELLVKRHNFSLTEIIMEEGGSVVEDLLNYVYTGKVDLDNMADQLILAAHKYELPELKRSCEKYLLQNIRPENAIQMYHIGKEIESVKLFERAFAIMRANKSKLVNQSDDFQRLSSRHPALMFQLFISS